MLGKNKNSKKDKINQADWRFLQAMEKQNLPILTLLPGWHALFAGGNKSRDVRGLEKRLNGLLKEQGKLNNMNKDMQGKKKILMNQIIYNMSISDDETERRKEAQGDLIEQINQRMVENEDALTSIPEQIKRVNAQLLLETFEQIYVQVDINKQQLVQLDDEIATLRNQLSKKMLEKQSREEYNHEIFGQMKDLVGMTPIDLYETAKKK